MTSIVYIGLLWTNLICLLWLKIDSYVGVHLGLSSMIYAFDLNKNDNFQNTVTRNTARNDVKRCMLGQSNLCLVLKNRLLKPLLAQR